MTMAAMDCRQLVELVTDYFEEALPERERRRFEEHLVDCRPCRSYLAQMRRTIQTLGHLEPHDVPPDAEAELLRIFRDWNQR